MTATNNTNSTIHVEATRDREAVMRELSCTITKHINEYNRALEDNDYHGMSNAEAALKAAEREYAVEKMYKTFEELKKADNPIKEGIIQLSFLTIGHKVSRENGVVIGLSRVEDKSKQIDLLKLADYCDIKPSWWNMIQKFNQLMCLRAAEELHMSASEKRNICKSYYMETLARELDMGATPTSNSQIVKLLQSILDAMVFEAGDKNKGKNVFRVVNHDAAFIRATYTRKGKTALSVATARHDYMLGLIAEVFHKVILNKEYTLEYQTKKDNEQTKEVSDTAEVTAE